MVSYYGYYCVHCTLYIVYIVYYCVHFTIFEPPIKPQVAKMIEIHPEYCNLNDLHCSKCISSFYETHS